VALWLQISQATIQKAGSGCAAPRNASQAVVVPHLCEGLPCVGHSYPTSHSGLESWNFHHTLTSSVPAGDIRDPNLHIVMRLLEIKGSGEFSLVQIAPNTTPAYAILSHTWTDG
jgi:hypothetical protein